MLTNLLFMNHKSLRNFDKSPPGTSLKKYIVLLHLAANNVVNIDFLFIN